MRNAWRIGCVLALATAAAGCERDAGAAIVDPEPTLGTTSEPALVEVPAAQERVPAAQDESATIAAQDERAAIAAQDESATSAIPADGDDPSAKPEGATEEELDPRIPRAMEFGRGRASSDPDLWPRGGGEDQDRGAFIVRRGEAYWTGGSQQQQQDAEGAAEPTEAEARIAAAEARAAEAE
ncbi:MAG: hypothetical protein M3Y87_27480, partial [Myxococcota bacterium]|nr:hypothetical protein [Myxococcota bacterium]